MFGIARSSSFVGARSSETSTTTNNQRRTMTIAINLLLGALPLVILGASWAAGTEDDRHHRRTFLFVYGLWSITLAMWNWMRSAPAAWIVVWLVAGVAALAVSRRR